MVQVGFSPTGVQRQCVPQSRTLNFLPVIRAPQFSTDQPISAQAPLSAAPLHTSHIEPRAMTRKKKAAIFQKRARAAGPPKDKQAAKNAPQAQPPLKKQKSDARDAKPSTTSTPNKPADKQQQSQSQSQQAAPSAPPPPPPSPTIPFDPNERILLIGEGDFSFARSLVAHHGCADLLATCYDSAATLAEKYPQAVDNIAYIEGEGMRVAYEVDATNLGKSKEVKRGGMTEGLVGVEGGARSDDTAKARGRWDRIVFMFPHTGGKSTDVNRQVRFNQGACGGAFKAADFFPWRNRDLYDSGAPLTCRRTPRVLLPLRHASSLALSPFSDTLDHHHHPFRRRAVHAVECARPSAARRTQGAAQLQVPVRRLSWIQACADSGEHRGRWRMEGRGEGSADVCFRGQ